MIAAMGTKPPAPWRSRSMISGRKDSLTPGKTPRDRDRRQYRPEHRSRPGALAQNVEEGDRSTLLARGRNRGPPGAIQAEGHHQDHCRQGKEHIARPGNDALFHWHSDHFGGDHGSRAIGQELSFPPGAILGLLHRSPILAGQNDRQRQEQRRDGIEVQRDGLHEKRQRPLDPLLLEKTEDVSAPALRGIRIQTGAEVESQM